MHDIIPSRPDHAGLFEIATGQHGYFTAEQARARGFDWDLLSYHARSGRFLRFRRGLYRFRDYPSWHREEVMAAWLAAGKDVAVVSHESALDLLDLSDVSPHAIHLTVPRSRRYLRPALGTAIHTTTRPLRPIDLTVRDGIQLTGVVRTILDAAEDGTAPEQIEMAVAQAIRRGFALEARIRSEAGERSERVATLVCNALDDLAR